MPYTTDTELLQQVRDAIHAIVSRHAASYTIDTGEGSRQYTALDLDTLRAMEKELERKINAATRGRFRVGVVRGAGA